MNSLSFLSSDKKNEYWKQRIKKEYINYRLKQADNSISNHLITKLLTLHDYEAMQ